MAGRLSKALLTVSIPTIIVIVSFYWLRRRKKGVHNGGQLIEAHSNNCSQFNPVESEQHLLNMQLLENSAPTRYASGTTSNGSVKSEMTTNGTSTGNGVEKLAEGSNGYRDASSSSSGGGGGDDGCSSNKLTSGVGHRYSKSPNLSNGKFSHRAEISSENGQRVHSTDEVDGDLAKSMETISVCDQMVDKSLSRIAENEEPHTHLARGSLEINGGASSHLDCNYNARSCSSQNGDTFSNDANQDADEEAKDTRDSQLSSPDSNHSFRLRENSGNGLRISCENDSQHSNFSDLHSEGSSDSGKGSSDIQSSPNDVNVNTVEIETEADAEVEEPVIIYQFELPQELCGRLIGKQGHFVNSIKQQSNASVIVNRHPYVQHIKICSIEATRSQVRHALQLIRKRFPAKEYPEVTLQQINVISPIAYPVPVPQSCQLHLPDGVSCDVILSSTVDAGHIFLQQPTHPTYPSLSRLDQFMNATYGPTETPSVPNPAPGIICAVPMMGGWYRTMVVSVDDEECNVKFVDYGGYTRIPTSSLRQIRLDFMTLPFQASECYLANVAPSNDSGWTLEANTFFEEIAQGQILQAYIVAYSEEGIPFVHLHKIKGASNVFINRELVDRGFARWVDGHFRN